MPMIFSARANVSAHLKVWNGGKMYSTYASCLIFSQAMVPASRIAKFNIAK